MRPNFKPLSKSRRKRRLFPWPLVLISALLTFALAYGLSTQVRFIEIEGKTLVLQRFSTSSDDQHFWVRPPWSLNWQELRWLKNVEFTTPNKRTLAHLPLSEVGFYLKSTQDPSAHKDSLLSLPKGAAAYRVFQALKDSIDSRWNEALLFDPRPENSENTSRCALNSDGDTLCLRSDQPLWQRF